MLLELGSVSRRSLFSIMRITNIPRSLRVQILVCNLAQLHLIVAQWAEVKSNTKKCFQHAAMFVYKHKQRT